MTPGLAARIRDFSVSFGRRQILHGVSLDVPASGITVLAGRSGSGKTTLLRALNRLNETFPGYHGSGELALDLGAGLEEIYPRAGAMRARRPVSEIRRRVGMVFQTPDVLPVSIADNIAIPLRVVAGVPRDTLEASLRAALVAVGLWEEVADRLGLAAERLSGGQQQRLCLARALALEPAMLLLDEPTASLDVHAAADIEELLRGLARRYPLIMVSHSPEQTARLADRVALMRAGRVTQWLEKSALSAATLTGLLEADDYL